MNEVSLKDKIDELRNINDKLSSALTSAENKLDLYKVVLKEIKEKIEFAKTTIEYSGDYSNVGYNFLISADKIVEILDKVEL